MVLCRHEHQATLGTTVQGEQGGIVPHGHDHSIGGIGARGCCGGRVCREKVLDCPREEGKPRHVLSNAWVSNIERGESGESLEGM